MAVPNDVINTIISVSGGVLIAYITNVVSKRVQAKREAKEPKDRVELLFERYDEALRQKDADNDELRAMLKDAEAKLHEANKKLNHSYYENSRLKGELEELKASYRAHRKSDDRTA